MAGRFRVGYLDRPMHQSFIDGIAADPALELLRIDMAAPDAEIRAALAGCHGYYARASRDELPLPWHVTPALLESMPRLLLVASYGAGYDTIDLDACSAAGVAVANQAGGNAEGVAEHAMAMILSLLKRIPEANAALQAGTAMPREAMMGREVTGRSIGLFGLGHVGGRMAAILNFFGCRVLACDPYLDAQACAARGAAKVDFHTLLAQSDVVSVHCPLTAETQGVFDAAAFARMRQGAIFVTTARGSIHDEAALQAALASGHLGGAGLDVWQKEPPATTHALLALSNVMGSNHTAGVTHESRERVGRMAAEAFSAVAAGTLPPRLLNPGVAPRFAARFEAVLGRVPQPA